MNGNSIKGKRILSVIVVMAMLLTQLCGVVFADGFDPYAKNTMASALTGGSGYGSRQGQDVLGGWSWDSYAMFKDVDFGDTGAESIKLGYGIDATQNFPGVNIYVIDYAEGDILSANFGGLTVTDASGEAKTVTKVCEINSLDNPAKTDWNTEDFFTKKFSEVITGVKSVVLVPSSAINLYSVQFNEKVSYEGGINPYKRNTMAASIRGGAYAEKNSDGSDSVGGYAGSAWVGFKDVNFGGEGAKSLTLGYGADSVTYGFPGGINVYTLDNYEDTDTVTASYGALTVTGSNGEEKTLNTVLTYSKSEDNPPAYGFSVETNITKKLSETLTGTKTVFIVPSAVVNLYSIQFNTTEEYQENMFFEMDLSDYTAENAIVKNAVTNNTTGIGVYKDELSQTYYPELNTLTTASGTKKYITTATEDAEGNVTEKGFINLYKELATPAAEAENLTIETWVRLEASEANQGSYRKLFDLSQKLYSLSSGDGNAWFMVDTGADGSKYRVSTYNSASGDNKQSRKNFTGLTKDVWTHLVVTRSWNETDSAWNIKIFANGEEILNTSSTGELSSTGEENLQIGTIGNAQGKTFIGSIGDFKLYSTALSLTSVKEKYEESKNDYVELSDEFSVKSPADGDEINPYAGELTVEFTNYFTAEEAKRAISFKKQVGDGVYEDINGGFTVEASGVSNTAKIRFGKLVPKAVYAILFDNMKAANDAELDTDSVIIFTNSGEYYVNTDFLDLEVGTNPTTDATGLKFTSSNTADSAADIYVRETANGTKYLEMNSTADSRVNTTIAYNFEPSASTPLLLEFGLKGNETTNEFARFQRGVRVSGAGVGFGALNSAGTEFNMTNSKGLVVTDKTTVTDADGFFNMKYILIPSEEGLTYYVYSEDDADFYAKAVIDGEYTTIGSLTLQQYLSSAGDPEMHVSHVRISDYVPTAITNETTYSDKKVVYTFNDDIDTNTLNNITVTDADGNAVAAVPAYNASKRELTLTFEKELYINDVYTVSFENVKNTDGIYLPITSAVKFGSELIGLGSDIAFSSTSGAMETINDISASGDTVYATFNLVNMTDADKDVDVMMALYDNGVLKNVSKTTVKALANGVDTPCEASLTTGTIDDLSHCEVKVFVWDEMMPVIDNWYINADGVCL